MQFLRVIRFTGMLTFIVLFALALSNLALAQEHPEHPTKPASKASAKPELSKETLAQAIADYVKKDSDVKGGYFLVYDGKAKKPLTLTLTKVHQDKLSKVGEGLYFACSDFKATDGKTYDLDFLMKDSDAGLAVTEIMIHKEEGSPRYAWYEEGGIWKRE
jgi:hypothetical protein